MSFNSNEPDFTSISWEPLKKGGANFKTHNLVEVSPERLEYKSTLFYKIFTFMFLAIGLVGGGLIFNQGMYIASIAFGVIFTGAGGFMFRESMRPIVFDKSEGYFWKGKKSPRDVINMDAINTYADLDKIQAIQVIDELVKSNKSPYRSYEINLVLKSGERLNVVDYGNLKKIEQDLKTLKNYLGVEVWRK